MSLSEIKQELSWHKEKLMSEGWALQHSNIKESRNNKEPVQQTGKVDLK